MTETPAVNNELTLGLIQAQLLWQQPEQNRRHLETLVKTLQQPVDLVILPETFTTGFLGKSPDQPEKMEGPTLEWMRKLALETGAVLTGSAAIEAQGRLYNRLLWVEPGGHEYCYDKKHLFSFAGEHQRYGAGTERKIWHWNDWRVCPQICYDLRFPVWCRSRNDYDLLLFVANWPSVRVDAWSALLRARAMENQCYVVGVNRVGRDGNNIDYPGCSVVFDPLGRSVTELGESEGAATARIDLGQVVDVRSRFPFQDDADVFELG